MYTILCKLNSIDTQRNWYSTIQTQDKQDEDTIIVNNVPLSLWCASKQYLVPCSGVLYLMEPLKPQWADLCRKNLEDLITEGSAFPVHPSTFAMIYSAERLEKPAKKFAEYCQRHQSPIKHLRQFWKMWLRERRAMRYQIISNIFL